MSTIIDGKRISNEIKEELKKEVEVLGQKGISVTLAVILVGNDPASAVYVGNKKKACEYIGINSLTYELPEENTGFTMGDILGDALKEEVEEKATDDSEK